MRKIIIAILLITLTGCSSSTQQTTNVETVTFESPIVEANVTELIFESDLIVKVEPLEDVSTKNSFVIRNESGIVEEFYNARSYKVTEVLSGNYTEETIIITEPTAYDAKNNQNLQIYDDGFDKRMQVSNEYLVYLEKMDDGYSVRSGGQARVDYSSDPLNEELSNSSELLEIISREGAFEPATEIICFSKFENLSIKGESINYFDKEDGTLYVEIDGYPYIATL